MGDAGEGLVDAESRLAERMEEREQEKRRARQAAKGGDPLANACQPEAGRCCHLGRIAAAIVLDMDQQRIFRPRAPLDPEHDPAR